MPRQNRRNPRQATADELASSIKKAVRQSENRELHDTLRLLPTQMRLPWVRNGRIINLQAVRKLEAAYVQMHGTASENQCTKCQSGEGPFQECVFADTAEELEILGGSCSNCYYERGYSGSLCSLRKPSQIYTGRERVTAPRSSYSKSKNDSGSFSEQRTLPPPSDLAGDIIPSTRSVPLLKRRSEESYAEKPSKKHISHYAADPVAPKRDVLNMLELELPKKRGDKDVEGPIDLFLKEEGDLAKLRLRDMKKIKKTINSFQESFEKFKAQEQSFGVKFLVRPSGSLQSPLAHYLNQPSFSTEQSRWEDGETADIFNPCTRMVMENVFEAGQTVMFDHLHHRSHTSEEIEDTQSQRLIRHESFTSDILESLEAKVIIVHGAKVQKRLIESRVLTFIPLWDEYDGVFVALDHESNYREPDKEYKFRRVFLFTNHPNRIMYQQKGSEVLEMQDITMNAAAQMAGVGHLVQRNFYREKRWSRDSPTRSAMLKQVRDLAQQQMPQPLHELVVPSPIPLMPTSASTKVSSLSRTNPLSWTGLWDDQQIYSNKTLAEGILPAALAVWRDSNDIEQDFDLTNLSDLPQPVLKWLQGSRYALFNSDSVPESDNEILSAIHRLAFKMQPKEAPHLGQALKKLMEFQYVLVKQMQDKSYNSLVHCGVGQALALQCNRCGLERIDVNPQWAVKLPGHYYTREFICKSGHCKNQNMRYIPADLDVFRTTAYCKFTRDSFDKQFVLRACLRTKDECSGLPDSVESWCIRCKEQTKISKGRTTFIDIQPRWTLGSKPLYVERRSACLSCHQAGHAMARFVPVKSEIASVMTMLFAAAAKSMVNLDREIKGHVMDVLLQPSTKTHRSLMKS